MKDAIVEFFNNEKVDPDDTLLFYYTGHGIRSDQDGTVYFSPSEIDPKLPVKRGFSFNEFGTIIQNSVSKRKVAILDCCFSGSAKIGKGPRNDTQLIASINEESKELEQGEGTCILAASQPYQGAYPLEEQGHSIFTYHLLEGLRGNEDSVDNYGNVTPYTLNKYIKKEIDRKRPEERPPQKSLMKSETSGEIILASYLNLRKPMDAVSATIPNANKDTDISADSRKNSSTNYSADKRLLKYKFLGQRKYQIFMTILLAAALVAITLNLHHISTSGKSNSQFKPPPKNEYVLYNKGDDLLNNGNYTQALPYLDKALAIDPNNEDVLYDIGDALNYLGNYKEALPYLDKALDIDPTDKYALNDKGWALGSLGNYTQEVSYLNKALAIDPTYKYALNNKGWALASLGNYTQAMPYLNKALIIDPRFELALDNKGWALDNLGNYTQAIPYLDKALAIDPSDEDALYNKGWALTSLGNYTQALPYLDKALAIDPTDTRASDLKKLAQASIHNSAASQSH